MSTTAIIRARGLTKRFGDFTAVDHLDLAVPPQSIFAFLGANGSGKSTTIRMLIGLLTPSEGTIEVDGVDVIGTPRRVRDHIGYMGQKVSLYRGLSLRENVEFYAGLFGLAGADLERRWAELRSRFGLGEAEDERAEDLPAGIRQRAGLAVAMLHRPRVLFLDEPTAGVDLQSRGLFWEIIQEDAAAGVTVFVTTHFLEEADFCDWVCLIAAGRLVADAPPEELRTRFGGGTRIDVVVAAPERAAVAGRLEAAGLRSTAAPDGLTLRVPELSSSVLAALDRLRREAPSVAVRVEPPEMSEVFRRALEEAAL